MPTVSSRVPPDPVAAAREWLGDFGGLQLAGGDGWAGERHVVALIAEVERLRAEVAQRVTLAVDIRRAALLEAAVLALDDAACRRPSSLAGTALRDLAAQLRRLAEEKPT